MERGEKARLGQRRNTGQGHDVAVLSWVSNRIVSSGVGSSSVVTQRETDLFQEGRERPA
jgi:hypothetical protein